MAYNRGKSIRCIGKDAAGILLMGAGYRCLVGRAVLRRPWSAKKLRIVALGRFAILTMLGGGAKIVGLVISHNPCGPSSTLTEIPGYVELELMDSSHFERLMELRNSGRIEAAVRESEILLAESTDPNERASLLTGEHVCYCILCRLATFRRKSEHLSPVFSYGACLVYDRVAQVPHAPADIGLRVYRGPRKGKNIGSE
jgi:hypothetical protein